MGLLVEQRTSKGITATYHRISELSADFTKQKLLVKIASYVDNDYRQQELDYNASLDELNAMRTELDELIQNANKDNVDRREELSKLINTHRLADVGEDAQEALSVFDKEYTFELTEDLASDLHRGTIYRLLITTPEFQGATDV